MNTGRKTVRSNKKTKKSTHKKNTHKKTFKKKTRHTLFSRPCTGSRSSSAVALVRGGYLFQLSGAVSVSTRNPSSQRQCCTTMDAMKAEIECLKFGDKQVASWLLTGVQARGIGAFGMVYPGAPNGLEVRTGKYHKKRRDLARKKTAVARICVVGSVKLDCCCCVSRDRNWSRWRPVHAIYI